MKPLVYKRTVIPGKHQYKYFLKEQKQVLGFFQLKDQITVKWLRNLAKVATRRRDFVSLSGQQPLKSVFDLQHHNGKAIQCFKDTTEKGKQA